TYRKGKKQTAIKVFTIADESYYLLIQKVPTLSGVNVDEDLRNLCDTFGTIEEFELVDYPQRESFTNVYLVKYERIIDAIRAKKRLDDYEFLGSILHVCYAPEHETIDDIRKKLTARKRYVGIKLSQCTNLLKNK
ncbi:prenyl protease-like protein, partial [Euroglyphus maynei]